MLYHGMQRCTVFNMHTAYEVVFFEHMRKNHFSVRNELPIVAPNYDKSLYFTNSTIVNFKPDIWNNSVTNCATRQNCLRLHNMSKILDNRFNVEWLSYFNMLGAIARPEAGDFLKKIIIGSAD